MPYPRPNLRFYIGSAQSHLLSHFIFSFYISRTAAQDPSCLWGVITYLYTLLDFPVYQSHAILLCVLLPSFMQTYMLQLLAPNRRLYTHSHQSSSSDFSHSSGCQGSTALLILLFLLCSPSLLYMHGRSPHSGYWSKGGGHTAPQSDPEWRLCHLLTDEDASICSYRTQMSWYFFAKPLMKSRCKFYQKKTTWLCGWICSRLIHAAAWPWQLFFLAN